MSSYSGGPQATVGNERERESGGSRSWSTTGAPTSSYTTGQYDHAFKIITLGGIHTGKTSLCRRYQHNVFNDDIDCTLGVSLFFKTVRICDKNIHLRMWDTQAQEKFRSIVTQYSRNSDGVLLVYDVTSMKSFDEVEFWFDFAGKSGASDAVKLLVGCKADLEDSRQVSQAKGEALAQKLNIGFFETSAKDTLNVETLFDFLTKLMLDYQISTDMKRRTDLCATQTITLNDSVQTPKPQGLRDRLQNYCCL